jgi:hypothetical protein
VRPGRCLAQIEVGPLPQDQARRWLGAGAGDRVGPAGASLAELYALRAEHEADVSTHTPAHPARAATLGS